VNSLVASEALKRVIMRNFARRNIRSISAVVANCTEQKGEEGDIYFLIKTPLKKKEEDASSRGSIKWGTKKKEEFRKGHAAKRDARRPKTRSKRSRTERSTIATPAFRRFFFPSLCFHPLRAERSAREKKRARAF
jgi:hypothetical protein